MDVYLDRGQSIYTDLGNKRGVKSHIPIDL